MQRKRGPPCDSLRLCASAVFFNRSSAEVTICQREKQLRRNPLRHDGFGVHFLVHPQMSSEANRFAPFFHSKRTACP